MTGRNSADRAGVRAGRDLKGDTYPSTGADQGCILRAQGDAEKRTLTWREPLHCLKLLFNHGSSCAFWGRET